MYLKNLTTNYTKKYLKQIEEVKNKIEIADAIIIGAGAGLSTSSGLNYSGERFNKYFADFEKKYNIHDMYSGGFYPFPSLETYWAYWSRFIYYNRYDIEAGKPYLDLLEVVSIKDYFVITTNVDHQFQLAGFNKHRLFYTQGDYGLWQCSTPCHQKTYNNEKEVREMLIKQKDLAIPTELIPYCPVCKKPMQMNLRSDNTFVEEEGWHIAKNNYNAFIQKNIKKNILFLELGVGWNTPVIIKFPFWEMTANNPNVSYISVNTEEAKFPKEIKKQSICINEDIGKSLELILKI